MDQIAAGNIPRISVISRELPDLQSVFTDSDLFGKQVIAQIDPGVFFSVPLCHHNDGDR